MPSGEIPVPTRTHYQPIDPSSSDGNRRLHVPDGATPDDTLVIVRATRGTPPAPGNLTVVGTPYNINASGGITRTTQPSSLRHSADPLAGPSTRSGGASGQGCVAYYERTSR